MLQYARMLSFSKTNGPSLIAAAGWDSSLSGESAGMYEFGTIEKSGVDNSASRAGWATVLGEAKLNDGMAITPKAFRYAAPVEDLYELKLAEGLKKDAAYEGGFSVRTATKNRNKLS